MQDSDLHNLGLFKMCGCSTTRNNFNVLFSAMDGIVKPLELRVSVLGADPGFDCHVTKQDT